MGVRNFNPHLPCGRWHFVQIFTANVSSISIHTFLAEGDGEYRLCHYIQGDFNPHLPCGRWQHLPIPRLLQIGFQSTPSLRKVTIYFFNHFWNGVYFNPHLPCGRWRLLPIWPPDISNFNPHLPCGRWRLHRFVMCVCSIFQSTPSLRKVTRKQGAAYGYEVFQSTPSLRKVTEQRCQRWPLLPISIHTFLAEGDFFTLLWNRFFIWFQSTPSLRKVTLAFLIWLSVQPNFNPHLPCGRWPYLLHFSPSSR